MAFRSLLRELAAKGDENAFVKDLRGLGSVARREVDRAGGIDGIGAIVADLNLGSGATVGRAPKVAAPGNRIGGTGLCAGRASGRARVAAGQSLPELGEDGVLVCDVFRDEWVPALGGVRAIVVETGGASSQSMRMARQRGLPVVRAAEARSRLPEGAPVTVDGRAGTISFEPARATGA